MSLTQPYGRPMHQCTALSRGCLGVGLVYILVHYILIEYSMILLKTYCLNGRVLGQVGNTGLYII